MMARLVRVMVSMRRRKLEPISAPPAMASSSESPLAHTKARAMACCISVSRSASCATSRNEPSGKVRPKPVSLDGVGLGLERVGLGHEIDDAVDRRHARQIADHDTAVGRLQEIEDGTARAEVHAPR